MEIKENGLGEAQALVSAPKNQENTAPEMSAMALQMELERKDMEACKRHKGLLLGSFIFALLYTFCIYKNTAGITYPFFVGGSLLLLYFCSKKYGITADRGNKWIAFSMMLLGIIQCTTASEVVTTCNRYMVWVLGLIMIMRMMQPQITAKWDIGEWLSRIVFQAFWSPIKGFEVFPDVWDIFQSRTNKDEQSIIKRRQIAKAVVTGLIVAVPLLIFIMIMLAGADAIFGNLVGNALDKIFDWNLPDFLLSDNFWFSMLMFASSGLAMYGLWRSFEKEDSTKESNQKIVRKCAQLTGYIIVCAVDLLYVFFCGIQILGLFLGKLSLPENYTYAEYAREGFFQLAALCCMNIVLVLLVAKKFNLNVTMKVLLLIICGCTYIMIAASAYKMYLYVRVYYLSFLRLVVLWALVTMTVLLSGVVIRIVLEKERVVEFFFITLLAAYCIFVVARPDYLIAKYNVARMDQTGWHDKTYVAIKLSTDTAPVWVNTFEGYDYPQKLKSMKRGKDALTFRTFNFSTYKAGVLAEKKLTSMGIYYIEGTEDQSSGWNDEIAEREERERWKQEKREKREQEKEEMKAQANNQEAGTNESDVESTDSDVESTDYTENGIDADSLIENMLAPDWWTEIEPECVWSFDDGSEISLVPVDRATGSNFYVMLGKDLNDSETIYIVNDDPFHGQGGGMADMVFLDQELGFVTLYHNAGENGSLFRSCDGGVNFEPVEIATAVEKVKKADGTEELITPYDTPAAIYMEEDVIVLAMGQGSDGDIYDNEHLKTAYYVSFDQGYSWNFLEVK